MSTLRRLFKPERDGARVALALAVIALVVFALARDQTQCARAAAGSCPVGDDETFAGDIAWQSNTAFSAAMEHANTAARTYTFANASGTVALNIPTPLRALKTADEVISGTSVQADDHLVVTLAASTTYRLTGLLIAQESSTGNLRIGWSAPAGAIIDATVDSAVDGTGANRLSSAETFDTVVDIVLGAAVDAPHALVGHVTTGVTAGTLTLFWGQGSAAGNTTLRAGSYLYLENINNTN